MSTDKIVSHKEGRIGTLTFNNPERLNAMSLEMWEAAEQTMADFERDPGVAVVVLTGAGGKAFVSGADISKFDSERASEAGVAHYNATTERAYGMIAEFPKPTIAMIRGYCIGGGLGLALCCDLRFATDSSRFALPAAKLGLGYGYSGIKRFVDIAGPANTKEFFFTARQFSAAEAKDMGILNRVVPDAEIEAFVRDYAATIGGNAPLTVRAAKFAINRATQNATERDVAQANKLVAQCFASQDYKEGRQAFMEKRKPAFSGT